MGRWGGFCEKRCRVVLFLLAYCLLPLASCPGDARADHLTPKHDPWAQPWELERLALLEVPEGMVSVPGGAFLMGSNPKVDRAAGPQEQPQRPVSLDAFEIDRYEVTNVYYLRFVLATGMVWSSFWM